MDFQAFLGGIERDESGQVIGAKTTLTQIVMRINRTEIDLGMLTNDAGLADEVRS